MADPQWKKNLRKASFRGVPFFVRAHDLSGGRRGVQHEYALRDKPSTEDLGRKGRKYSVDAYVLGPDYMPARDALIKACEEEGPGELIHPYYGRLIVNCFDFRVGESVRDGGMATFSLTLVESGENAFPDSIVDAQSATAAAAAAMVAAKKVSFLERFSVLNKPQFIVDKAVSMVREIGDSLQGILDKAGAGKEAVATAQKTVDELRSKADELVHTPENLLGQVESAFGKVKETVSDARALYQSMFGATDIAANDAPIQPTTETRRQEQTNQNELNELAKVYALQDASVAAVAVPYESTDDAKEIRDSLLDVIDETAETTASDDVYSALQDLRVEVVRNIPGDTQNLASVSKISLQQTKPSLAVAYDIYGSVEQESDIIKRNGIEHPGFIKGGTPIEVLVSEQ